MVQGRNRKYWEKSTNVTYLGYFVLNHPWARSENVGGIVLAPPLLYYTYSILTAISEDTGLGHVDSVYSGHS